jgi:hypothetical protein
VKIKIRRKWLQQGSKLFCQFLRFLRPADIRRPCILERSKAPLAVALDNNKRLDRVSLWLEISLSSHNRPANSVHYSNVGGQEANACDFSYKAGSFEKHIKEVLVKRSNFFAPLEVRAIKPYQIAIFFKWSCKGIATACIPSINCLLVKAPDCGLVSTSR